MPTTYDADKEDEIYAKQERKRRAIFKIAEPIVWLILIIIVVVICLGLMILFGSFSVPNPIDAVPTFSY